MITAFARTVILYVLITGSLRLTGKRQIGELEPSELVLTMMISDLAAVPMQDFGIPLLAGVIPILTLLALSLLFSQISLRSYRFREVMCGKPAVLIDKGVIRQGAMRRNRYTVDELMEELRQQGYASIEEVRYAVLENSGQLSVLPGCRYQPLTQDTLETGGSEPTLPVIVVSDGAVLRKNLKACGRNEAWLNKVLKKEKLQAKDVFLLTVDEDGKTLCVAKEEKP